MGIPFAVAVDLHEAHAALDEAAGHEAFAAEVSRRALVQAVHFLGFGGLRGKVHQVGGFHLHAVGQLERVDAGGEIGFARMLGQVVLV